MVTVTERAARLLKDIQAGHEEATGRVLRLVSKDDGFRLTFDERREGDIVVQSGETDVLLIADEISEALGEATIDGHGTLGAPRFTVTTQGGGESA